MKRFFAMLLAGVLGLTACAGETGGNGTYTAAELTAAFDGTLTGEITVSVFDSMIAGPFLEEAARLFEYQNPGTLINVETFSSMPQVRRAEGTDGAQIMLADGGDRSQERRDYINMVNTELMSGRGPDILALDVLPFHEYARIGQLADLRPFMDADPDFDMNDYRVNILDALTDSGGRQFMFPVDYDFRYAAYDSSLFADSQLARLESGGTFSFEQMAEIGQMSEMSEHLFGMPIGPARGLFQEIFVQNHSQFIDIENRQANFDDGTFADLLNFLAGLEEGGHVPPRTSAIMRDPDAMQRLRSERFAFKPRPSTMLLNDIQRMAGQQGAVMVAGGGAGAMGNTDDDKIAGIMSNNQGEIPFTVGLGLGINANSDNQLLAWKFIRFVSGEAVTQSLRMRGLPTNIAAFEERAALSVTGQLFAAAMSEAAGEGRRSIPEEAIRDEPNAADLEILAEYIALVEYFTGQLNTFFTTDFNIEEIVLTEAEEFFNGSRTAEETAAALQSRVMLVLNE